jgi:hypothetical protein
MTNHFIYTDDIPASGNNPSVDQPKMKVNTNSIDSLIAVDHISFNTDGSGIHKQVTLLNESAPGLGDGDGVLYSALINGQAWPVWQNALGSTSLLSGQPNSGASSAIIYLAGGIIIITSVITGGGLNTSNVTATFPYGGFPTACFSVLLTSAVDDNSTIRMGLNPAFGTNGITKTQFQTQQTSSSHLKALYFIAIGN